MQFWNELEGRTIDGLFPLRRLVRSEGRSAWFETETPAPKVGRATISLTEALTDADEVTARLQAAQNLKHPNLVAIEQVGQVRIDNTLVVYAVMEHIEQSLSDVLQSQALSPEEGREVAEALVGALTAVHQSGMAHGHVEAASVLATEETVKLRSDCLQSSAAGQAEDVVGVGSTLFHAFTQRKAASATDAQMNRIPAPFGEIVRNALARRWSLAQIANALKPTPPVPAAVAAPIPAMAPPAVAAPSRAEAPPPPPVKRPDPAPIPPAAKPAVTAPPPAPAKTPPVTPSPVPPLIVDAYEPTSSAKRRPLVLYGAVAVVVLAILGWLFLRPHTETAPVASNNAPAVTPAPTPAPAPPEKPAATKPSPVAGARTHKPAPAPVVAAADTPRPSSGRTVWRVVVYTYRGQTKAEDSVAKIKGAHPDLDAAVFNPNHSDVYMVTLGGPMDHPQANAMLARARREGLPQDTYVRNFAE